LREYIKKIKTLAALATRVFICILRPFHSLPAVPAMLGDMGCRVERSQREQ